MAIPIGRSLQRLLLTIVIGLLFISIIATHYPKPEYTRKIASHVQYYHDKVKQYSNYQLQSLTGEAEGLEELGHSVQATEIQFNILNSLDKPALQDPSPPLDHEKYTESQHKDYKKLFEKEITEPKTGKLTKISQSSFPDSYQLANATFVSLVRNSELKTVLSTIKQIQSTFNEKYNYPYVFLNDETFTDRFKNDILKALPNSKVEFGVISGSDWNRPTHVDKEKEEKGLEALEKAGVGYVRMLSYHNMCRYYSMGFYRHELMKNYRYYWRVEPGVKYFCDIDYDMFKFMEDNGKVYGFVIALYDSPDSVKNLWPVTVDFLKQHPEYIHENSAHAWLRESLQNPENYKTAQGYSTCHFWSNFEIGDMDFYRSPPYSSWMEYLDKDGGFYYDRWGDAPVHSVGVGLFADKKDIHWFRDVGYFHPPYYNSPNKKECMRAPDIGTFSTGGMEDQDCLVNWVNMAMTKEQVENEY